LAQRRSWLRTVWGKIRNQEDYEDTERVSALDRLQGSPV
jgi:hypothetical protein